LTDESQPPAPPASQKEETMGLQHVETGAPAAFAAASAEPLLAIRGLTVKAEGAAQPLIEDLSLTINRGEVVALVGESGSGKSMTALSLVRLLPRGVSITAGEMRLEGRDIAALPEGALDGLRGGEVAMLFQQPHAMLDPTCQIREQIAEPLRWHRGLSRRRAFGRVVELMTRVGIPDPAARSRAYAHELSGGMAQRMMIATAMGPAPKLLIADEPTTALDVTVQAQILALMDKERRDNDLSILLITHDLSVVSAFADRVAVMYSGRIVEEGPTAQVMADPQHPYTRALIRCSLLEPEADGRLLAIPGSQVRTREIATGCRFAPRCAMAAEPSLHGHCAGVEPALSPVGAGRAARCHAVRPISAS
jgi:peptide/nickel transport system ATP-binding protein